MIAFAEYAILPNASQHLKVDKPENYPWSIYVGIAGMPGSWVNIILCLRANPFYRLQGKLLMVDIRNISMGSPKRWVSSLHSTSHTLIASRRVKLCLYPPELVQSDRGCYLVFKSPPLTPT